MNFLFIDIMNLDIFMHTFIPSNNFYSKQFYTFKCRKFLIYCIYNVPHFTQASNILHPTINYLIFESQAPSISHREKSLPRSSNRASTHSRSSRSAACVVYRSRSRFHSRAAAEPVVVHFEGSTLYIQAALVCVIGQRSSRSPSPRRSLLVPRASSACELLSYFHPSGAAGESSLLSQDAWNLTSARAH